MSKAIRIKKDANNSIDGVMEVYRAFEGSERLNLTITRVGRGDYVCAWKSIGYGEMIKKNKTFRKIKEIKEWLSSQ